MNRSISRAQFLRGDFRGTHTSIRPPWSVVEQEFQSKCNHCGDCVRACDEKIIKQDKYGFPYIDFRRGECTFCEQCVKACTSHALEKISDQPPWQHKAVILDSCLPYKKIVCGRCKEECEVEAINMRLLLGGIAIPQLNTEACTGCGACVKVCPASSITMQQCGETA